MSARETIVFDREIMGIDCEIEATFEGDTIYEITATTKKGNETLSDLYDIGYFDTEMPRSIGKQLEDDAWDEKSSARP